MVIYYKDHPIAISENPAEWSFPDNGLFVKADRENLSTILDLVRNCVRSLFLYTDNEQETLNDLIGVCKLIEAAGGVVSNAKGEVLVIRRNDKWDLPKGKLEKGESIEEGARREIEEECGVTVRIVSTLLNTIHLYDEKDKRVFKRTYWFKADLISDTNLKPQLEEGITEVRWIRKSELPEIFNDTFSNIRDVLNAYFNSSSGN
jgi:8-oxo-dGTP pyrophosphatase MutT (NUDIX family)